MEKYAIIIDEDTKEVRIGVGCSEEYYKSIGMTLMEVEQAYNDNWYVKGYAPEKPAPTPAELKQEEILDLLGFLQRTDYVAIKIAEGVAKAEDYKEILEQRQQARVKISELEG